MRYGVFLDQQKPIDDVIGQARSAAAAGFGSVWANQVFGPDALTMLALIGREVEGIELGTSVVPVYPQHPLTLAGSALTTQAASGGRLALGIGLSHQPVVENMWGYSFDKPVRYMREYLAVLNPALRGEQVQFKGEVITGVSMGPIAVRVDKPPSVLLAALGPAMLKLCREQADGTVTWMTGPATIDSHIRPGLGDAGRIVCALPTCLTSEPATLREQANQTFAIYGQLPSYRAMLDREGAAAPGDVAVVGDEAELSKALDRLADAGVTDFVAARLGSTEDWQRTLSYLASRL
jgi:5,10-methylenetetrahydromethanopterin reductase